MQMVCASHFMITVWESPGPATGLKPTDSHPRYYLWDPQEEGHSLTGLTQDRDRDDRDSLSDPLSSNNQGMSTVGNHVLEIISPTVPNLLLQKPEVLGVVPSNKPH